ncbi:MAG: zinc-ribbon domain-containing protein [Gammaproteobacteria bacterium]|nr:zinc-ribbon domain-containing protein [Gammaproteobacteria bacterium]
MAFKQVQCPNCFTEYAIPEEQLKLADGIIRCGTCRGQYRAIVLSEDHTPAQFDPRDVFIEPMSNPLEEDATTELEFAEHQELSYVDYQQQPKSPKSNIELVSSHEFDDRGLSDDAGAREELGEPYGNSDELSTSEILKNLRKKSRDPEPQLELTIDDQVRASRGIKQPPSTEIKQSAAMDTKRDDELINEVDRLVDKNLTSDKRKTKNSQPKIKLKEQTQLKARGKSHFDDDDFLVEPKRKRGKQLSLPARLLFSTIQLIGVLFLVMALAYQLWLKQVFDIPEQVKTFEHPVLDKIFKLSEPYWLSAIDLAGNYGLTLPKRKNLGMLELVSAQTEPHATRNNTILLKVSLINHAHVSQSLPWLEMSLMDSQGSLIARRSLSPQDYIYNNRTDTSIGSKELKKITVELLSFPKNASGYEIKIVDH